MKLTPELIKQTISQVAGEDVLPLVEKLKKQDNLSEFILAQQVNYEINTVRNMLYRLYHANLVSFTRKKDKQKGWYIYYWTFRPNMIKDVITKMDKERLDGLKSRLVREQGKEFYRCPSRCIRMEFIRAMEYDFKCPECGSIINHEDNSENLSNIKHQIQELEQKIELKRHMRMVVDMNTPLVPRSAFKVAVQPDKKVVAKKVAVKAPAAKKAVVKKAPVKKTAAKKK